MDTLYLMVTITDRKLEKKFLKLVCHAIDSVLKVRILPRD